jgi:hypothetical protein
VAVAPVANSANSGSTSSSLSRDFPVDSKSHAPVLGLASTSPTIVHAARGSSTQQPTVQRPETAYPSPATHPAAATPSYSRQPGPGPARSQTPTQQAAPAQRYTQPAPSHPTYSPAPAPRPTYSSPPPPPHPTYSPPPAPPSPSTHK